MARIVVCGYMIRYPVAGNLLAYFHYVLGLHRLGHEVLYLEESGWPNACYDPVAHNYGDDPQAGLQIVRTLLAEHGLKLSVCYVNRDSGSVVGASWDDLKRMLAGADLLLNIGGVCWLPELRLCRRRALVDMDPLFTQVGKFGAYLIDDHHLHFSYGSNIGRSGCTIPTGDVDWIPTVPPVVPEIWHSRTSPQPQGQASKAPMDAAFTTVANWSAYGSVTYRGEHYGQKSEEFLRLLDLPGRVSQRLELALSGGGNGVMERLRAAGWSIRNAGEVSSNIATYQAYIANSRGELSAAKHAYVKAHTGWFSDRSVCYLAAGRPTILQDTGFSDWLPTGRGVLAFSSAEEAADCVRKVSSDYVAHCHAASEIAERVFSYHVVLPRLLAAALDANISYQPVVQLGGI